MASLATHELRPCDRFFSMAFGGEGGSFSLAAAMHRQYLEVHQLRHHACGVHAQHCLRKTGIPFSAVNELTARTLGELDLRRHAVGKRQPSRRGPGGLRQRSHGSGVEKETKEVEEV